MLAKLCNVCWGNDILLDYLGTGQLNWQPWAHLPLGAFSYTDPEGRPPLDWIGLNFYSRCSHSRLSHSTAIEGAGFAI